MHAQSRLHQDYTAFYIRTKYNFIIYMLYKNLFHWLKHVLNNTIEHGQEVCISMYTIEKLIFYQKKIIYFPVIFVLN